MRSRSQYSENYSRASPYATITSSSFKNPKVAAYYDERNYKNSKVNHAYSFGGKTNARFAFKDPAVTTPADNTLLRPSSSGSYRRKGQDYNVRSQVDDCNPVYKPDAKRASKSPNKPPRATQQRFNQAPLSRVSV